MLTCHPVSHYYYCTCTTNYIYNYTYTTCTPTQVQDYKYMYITVCISESLIDDHIIIIIVLCMLQCPLASVLSLLDNNMITCSPQTL